MQARIFAIASLTLAGASVGFWSHAAAETLEGALAQAYQNNPSLNAQRAAVRSTDESVPQALSGYRPTLSLNANAGYNYDVEPTSAVTLGPPTTNKVAQPFVPVRPGQLRHPERRPGRHS